jgi:hypothetical protein
MIIPSNTLGTLPKMLAYVQGITPPKILQNVKITLGEQHQCSDFVSEIMQIIYFLASTRSRTRDLLITNEVL